MQREARTKLVTDKISHERPRFVATAVIRPKHRNTEGAPWSTNENGAQKEPEDLGLRAVTRVGPEDDAPLIKSGSLLRVAGTGTSLDSECSSTKVIYEKESNMLQSESSSEPDTRRGGSIRDRIAALTAAAGVTRLDTTPGREQTKKPLTQAAVKSHEDEENEKVKAGFVDKSPKSNEEPSNTGSEAELSQISPKSSVAFEVGFQNATKNRPPPRVLSRFRTNNVESKKEEIVSESLIVSSKEIGAVTDKALAFEVSFVDEPLSKRAKDEPVLVQSPFKTLKTRSNLRRQQKSKPSQPIRAQHMSTSNVSEGCLVLRQKDDSKPTGMPACEEVSDRSFDVSDNVKTVKKKQHKFSFVSHKATSKELPDQNTSNDLITNEEHSEDNDSSKSSKLLKRNTFTIDSVSDQGSPIAKVLNELASKEESRQETVVASREPIPKRSTFTLESVSRFIEGGTENGLPVVNVLNDLANKEELKQSKLQSDVNTASVSNEKPPKRNTFTLESVAKEIDNAIKQGVQGTANDEEEKSHPNTFTVDTFRKETSTSEEGHETSEKRSTYSLDAVSSSLQSGSDEGLPVVEVLNQLAKREELQSSAMSDAENSPAPVESVQKRGTFTLHTVSQTLEDAEKKGVPPEEVLDQLASEHESCQAVDAASQDKLNTKPSENRSTFTLDTVSQTLEDAESKGLPTVEALDQLASEQESHLPPDVPLEDKLNTKPAQNRDTYTLDTVSHAIEEAVEKGIPVSVTLNHLAQEERALRHTSAHRYGNSSTGEDSNSLNKGTDDPALPSDDRDEIEACFEDALEQLEDCLTYVSFPSASDRGRSSSDRKQSFTDRKQSSTDLKQSSSDREQSSSGREQSSTDRKQSSSDRKQSSSDRKKSSSDREQSSSDHDRSSEAPGKRGTYNLDEVSTAVEDGAKDGVPVIETLEHLSKTKSTHKEGVQETRQSEQKRRTYTLDEVSRSLQNASEQGIPVVEALRNMTKTTEHARGTGEGAQKRGTYTLDDVSKSLERAKKTGIPVIEALESLSKEKSANPLRLKIPERGTENRGTYTLDEVSQTLEKAKQRGLPVVEALGQLTAGKDVPLRGTPDAVHRRQEKLVNRKTYALASPLETIGEGTKLRLYDGSQRQMLSPLSLHIKTKEVTPRKANSSESKARGLGVVQKLDFLTSACELLLEANAKEMAKDREQTTSESSRNSTTIDESVRSSQKTCPDNVVKESFKDGKTSTDGKETDRHTYSLDTVSRAIDDAKAAGIPVVDTLKSVIPVAKPSTTRRTNLMRLNSKSDSELIHDGYEKKSSDRYTHSLGDMPRTIEDAKKAGIPVIQALDQLANDLAEFSRTALGEDIKIAPLEKENRKRKRYSEIIKRDHKPAGQQSPHPSPHGSPYPSPMRKAHSLDDVAFAVQQAFQAGTSLTDFLDSIAPEKPVEPVSSSRDVRPRSVDSGFLSSLSDYDISSQSFDSPRNRSNTYILDSSNEDLDLAKTVDSQLKDKIVLTEDTTLNEDRRTFTLDHVSGSVEHEISRGVPVVEALGKLSNSSELKMQNTKKIEAKENAKNISTATSDKTIVNNSVRKKSPPKPKRQISKKTTSPQTNSDAFVVEFFSSNGPQGQNTSKFQIVNNKVEEVNSNSNETNVKNPEKDITGSKLNSDDTSPSPMKDPESEGLNTVSTSTPSRGRATWRPSGSVLDKIASLMDAAEDCGMSPSDVLNQVTDLPCEAEGEIEEPPQEDVEDEQAVTSQIAYLRMQLEEKRRHIEAEKHRAQAEWEDQRRRLGQTAFWYVIGKAQGGQGVGEGTGPEVLQSEKVPIMKPHSHETPRKPVPEFPSQPSPPIAWSSPANSPLPASALKSSPPNDARFETREFRLSDYPPGDDLGTSQSTVRPSSQPAVGVGSSPTPGPPRPSSHEPASSRPTGPMRKCWDVNVGQVPTPPPLVHPDTESVKSDAKEESNNVQPQRSDAGEIEVEIHTPQKKGLAMFIGDDASPGTQQGLTPEQQRKREKFMKLRQKKQEEDRTRKEAELEKKRRKEEKQREKEMLQKMEEERLRHEEMERRKSEQELRMREAQAQAARVPDSYATYRRPGPQQHVYDVNDDATSYFSPAPAQPSGFAEFSGPQCYVKPSGKSNRKIMVNAISHVCLSGTVNQDQKEKCLQAISESDGHHFMILFKDGLKFRGIYVHNLGNDQLFKIFGIGPRVITNKMIESLYKYNSGGKEFTKIPSKTLSISVDGFAIQKSCWHTSKPVVQSKTSSNLKRPPRPPQR